jgi:hypothetical protein
MLQRGPVGILAQASIRYRISRTQWSANVRCNTSRADFFTVIDYYLAQPHVFSLLTSGDLMNYQRLERRDQMMRAINALLLDKPEQAATFCPDIFSMSALRAALQTRRGMAVLVLGLYLKMMLSLRCHQLAKATLTYLKRMTNK